jgi:hypothetical protein
MYVFVFFNTHPHTLTVGQGPLRVAAFIKALKNPFADPCCAVLCCPPRPPLQSKQDKGVPPRAAAFINVTL